MYAPAFQPSSPRLPLLGGFGGAATDAGRELEMRDRVYSRKVAEGTMTGPRGTEKGRDAAGPRTHPGRPPVRRRRAGVAVLTPNP